jgi:bifunctional non-homologous end joining protein LigD
VPAQRTEQVVEVGGRRLKISNLDKVLYPATGTTKGEVLHYVTAAADLLLPHLRDRAATRKRWPNGVADGSFFEKNVPRGAPSWLPRTTLPAPGSTKDREVVTYPFIDDLPALVWATNLASLELHVHQWRVRRGDWEAGEQPDGLAAELLPDLLVVDLDPGPPAGLPECAEVALAVRERLAADGLECHPVTSGGKGMQLYAAVSGEQSSEVISGYAHRLAEELEQAMPRLVLSRMTKVLRKNKVFLDWSQNNGAKTTICPYSPRGRDRPTVAAPRTWDELADPGSLYQLEFDDVLERLADGDPLAGLLPAPGEERGVGPAVPEG